MNVFFNSLKICALKKQSAFLQTKNRHFTGQYGSLCSAKRPILHDKSPHFAQKNDPFSDAKWAILHFEVTFLGISTACFRLPACPKMPSEISIFVLLEMLKSNENLYICSLPDARLKKSSVVPSTPVRTGTLLPLDYTTLLIINHLQRVLAVEGMFSGDVFVILVLVDLQRLTSFLGVVFQFIFSHVSGTGILSIPLNTLQRYELNSTFNHILTEK